MGSGSEKKYDALTRKDAPEVYALIDDLVKVHHASDLADAKIGAMYVYDVKEDRDGRVWWGRARKVSERDQEYHDHDFVIDLNFSVWRQLEKKHQRALMDHELCHCGRIEDEDGGSRYYLRRHDLEEFHAVVERHGLWRPEVEQFIRKATGQEEATLFEGAPSTESVVKDIKASDRRTASAGR